MSAYLKSAGYSRPPTDTCTRIHIYIYTYMHIDIYTYIHVYMYIYIYIYIYMQMYYGEASGVSAYLKSSGYPCPPHIPAPEFSLSLVSVNHETADTSNLSAARVHLYIYKAA